MILSSRSRVHPKAAEGDEAQVTEAIKYTQRLLRRLSQVIYCRRPARRDLSRAALEASELEESRADDAKTCAIRKAEEWACKLKGLEDLRARHEEW
jgi:hypothetical protein